MREEGSDSARKRRIENEAAEWVARKFSGFTPSEQDEFFEWLAADPSHSDAYLRYQELWGRMDALAEWAPEHSEKPLSDLLKTRSGFYRRLWLGGCAAALVLGAFLWASWQTVPEEANRQNFVASAYESHELPDGSIVEMRGGAALVTRFTKAERKVELVASEALFNVARDENRPFIVVAKGVEVRAVGTEFKVGVSGSEVKVLVTEGKVRVGAAPAGAEPKFGTAAALFSEGRDMVAGQRSTVSLDGEGSVLVVEEASSEDILKELDWRYRLEFDSISLAEAVEHINRRGGIKLIIVDPELSRLPIVGTLRIDKMDHFVELLELSLGIRSEIDSHGRILLKKGRDTL